MSKTIITQTMLITLASKVAKGIRSLPEYSTGIVRLYGVPRGGVPASLAVATQDKAFILVDACANADIIIDDIIDSGETKRHYSGMYPEKPFFALIDKVDKGSTFLAGWIVFPWEEESTGGIEDNIRRLLQFVGEDPKRGGLIETPKRVAKAWQQWCSGYGVEPKDILKVFEDGAEQCDEMVIVKDIPFYSHCEHHLAAIFGTVSIAYVPNGKIVGLSKLSRLADIYARRLQVQERFTNQVAQALVDNLTPKGVAVVVKARHLCMESRGICKQGHYTITSSLHGIFKENAEARAEFISLVK